jgi:hypothetical protein
MREREAGKGKGGGLGYTEHHHGTARHVSDSTAKG